MDSKLVVEQMSGRWQIKHEDMRRLAREARAVFPAERVRYTWVPRAQNAHADRLANEAMDAAASGRPLPLADRAREPEHAQTAPRASVPDHAGEPTTLLLARHGRTADTLRGAFAGRDGADPPLSPEGEADAARLAAVLRRLGSPSLAPARAARRRRRRRQPAAAGAGHGQGRGRAARRGRRHRRRLGGGELRRLGRPHLRRDRRPATPTRSAPGTATPPSPRPEASRSTSSPSGSGGLASGPSPHTPGAACSS